MKKKNPIDILFICLIEELQRNGTGLLENNCIHSKSITTDSKQTLPVINLISCLPTVMVTNLIVKILIFNH